MLEPGERSRHFDRWMTAGSGLGARGSVNCGAYPHILRWVRGLASLFYVYLLDGRFFVQARPSGLIRDYGVCEQHHTWQQGSRVFEAELSVLCSSQEAVWGRRSAHFRGGHNEEGGYVGHSKLFGGENWSQKCECARQVWRCHCATARGLSLGYCRLSVCVGVVGVS